MIPILFDETEENFTSLGIGALSDAISCISRRVLNGMDEIELRYPNDGIRANEIANSRIIFVQPEYKKSAQPYRIYDITKPMNGIFVVYARHISEQRSYIPVMPFTASNVSTALQSIEDYCAEDCPFTFWTNKDTVANFEITEPRSLGAVLGGMAGSILDVYGGEYEFDGYTVKLWGRRGEDRGVTLRYGKNITDIQQEESIDATITGICPFWSDYDGNTVVLPEKVVRSANAQNFPFNRTIVKDFSDSFDEQPTVEQLRAKATAYVSQAGFGVPNVNIKVSFEMLSQYEEYETLASLETVNLGDTVHVIFEKLNINADARVVEIRFDCLNEKYKSIQIGRVKSNMSTAIANIESNTNATIKETKSFLEKAIDDATEQLTGADGGYLVDIFDANGNRIGDMLMDTNDPATATNVWLRNIAGWGHSSTGVNGQYTTAITQDGKIVADFIKAGTIRGIDIVGTNITGESTLVVGELKTIDGSDYSQTDLDRITQIILGSVTPTDADYEHLDVNNDGVINLIDSVVINNAITNGSVTIDLRLIIDAGRTSDQFLTVGTTKVGASSIYAETVSAGKLELSGDLSVGGSIYANGHGTPIGSRIQQGLSSDMLVSASTSSATGIVQMELPAGVWYVNGYAKFTAVSGSGQRTVNIADVAGQFVGRIRNDCPIISGQAQQLECSGFLNVSATLKTFTLNVSSSVACSVTSDYTQITAVRIA